MSWGDRNKHVLAYRLPDGWVGGFFIFSRERYWAVIPTMIDEKITDWKETEMLEIKGKVNTAICYASVIEEEAIEQIRRMCDYEFTAGSKVRIMPDVHAGKGD